MRFPYWLILAGLQVSVKAQQIRDIWQTTWDKASLLAPLTPSSPINFGTPGTALSVDITVDDTKSYQTISGFGGTLTDSSALTLNNLKNTNSDNYNKLLQYMFSPTDGAKAAGLNYVRVPIGATDFSSEVYSLDETKGDTSFTKFDSSKIPSYVSSVLKDILAINSGIKIHILPWSPPAWMKNTTTMNGGSISSQYISSYSTYLLKAVQAVHDLGLKIYAISIQNEVENSNPTYPSCTMSIDVEGQIGTSLRTALNNNGHSGVKIIGYEHNWSDAGGHPVHLMEGYGDAFAGVAFHCYRGTVSDLDTFHNAQTSKAIYMTECTGKFGTDWWADTKWFTDTLWIGALERYSQSGLAWNIALDGSGNPKLAGANSCESGCRALVTVNSDGSYKFNPEFYSMAQASKAIIPKDAGGPYGQRIGVSVSGKADWPLRVGAYVTKRLSSSDQNRYSIVVLNWNDSADTTFNPQSVTATIEFRGKQATYTFPVGVTTLGWLA